MQSIAKTYYFEKAANVSRLRISLEEWLGTPFRHRTGVKGRGVDCIHFVAGVFADLGLMDLRFLKPPEYPPDWHLHNTREILYAGVKHYLNVEDVNIANPMDGDILLSHHGKASSHAQIYYNGYLYQALTGAGVVRLTWGDPERYAKIKFNLRVLA